MRIMIASPTHIATGGTELLQQLCNSLRMIGADAYMYYFSPIENTPVEEKFSHYSNPYVRSVDDVEENVLIVSETNIGILYRYHKCKKIIWWLSVDNYYGTKVKLSTKYKLLSFINPLLIRKVLNCVQSEYAREYLIDDISVDPNKIMYLSDYISEKYVAEADEFMERDNIIVYNPKKGLEFTKKLMASISNYVWVPLINLTEDQMISTIKRSKVYVDFGNHPGKDRIPREAALLGCCIITGKRGAAGNSIDVPIPSRYKFDEDEIDSISERINECMTDYIRVSKDFDKYREIILNEKKEFKNDTIKLFQLINQEG